MATTNPPHDFPLERTVPGPRPEASAPTAVTPPPLACDAHCHVFGPAADFPFSPNRSYTPPDSGIDDFERLQDRLGLERAVSYKRAVTETTTPQCCMRFSEATAAYAGVAMIDDSYSDEDLARLHANQVRGIRFNFVAHLGGEPDMDQFWRLVHRVAPLGWHIVLHLDAKDFSKYESVLDGIPVPYIIDHMARVPAVDGVDQEALRLLLARMRSDEKCWVKIKLRRTTNGGPGGAIRRRHRYRPSRRRCRTPIGSCGEQTGRTPTWSTCPTKANCSIYSPESFPDVALRNQILVDNPQVLYDFS